MGHRENSLDLGEVMSDGQKPKRKPNKGTFTKDRPGPGRPAGVPNKATKNAREAIAEFIDGNAERLNRWLDEIEATEGPKAAFQCFQSVLEHHVPKLARTEVTGKDGGPVEEKQEIKITFVRPDDVQHS